MSARGPRRQWLAPDLALIAACVALFYCLFLFEGYQKLFRDSDAGWHIRAGQLILETHQLPRTDPFSFPMAGRPWYAWEWLSDVIAGTIEKNWGLSGVAFFYGVAIAAGVWLWFRLNWRAGGNFLLAAAFAVPMLSTTNLHWIARPHILSWLFLLYTCFVITPWSTGGPRGTCVQRFHSWRRLLTVAILSTLWANVHASFFLAPLLFLLTALALTLQRFVWSTPEKSAGGNACFTYALVSLCATLLNPYGYHLHQHVFRYLTDSSLLDRIGEFQSFNFHADGAFQMLLALGISALGGVLALTQKNLPVFFLSVFLIAAALRSARGLPLVALLLLPFANGAITRALEAARGLRPDLRRAMDRFLAYSERLRSIDARCSGLIWAPVFALLMLGILRTPAIAARTGFPPSEFPVAASRVIETLPLDDRLLAPDKFGGYLIYRFRAQRKVFFDGRSDLYGAEFLKQYGRLVQVRPGWRDILASYGFQHALLPNDYSLIPALEQSGWKVVYRDQTATLLAAPI